MGFLDSVKKVGLAVVTGGASTLVEHRQQQKLLETGMPARAMVKDFRQQWDAEEGRPRRGASRMTLEVRREGDVPYDWSGDIWVRTRVYYALPGEIVGSELPVKGSGRSAESRGRLGCRRG